MQKTVRTLFADDNKATWATGAKKTIKIPTERWQSEILLRCDATYNSAASATKAQDGVLNLIKTLTLKVNGKPVRTWSPARYWYLLPLDLGTVPEFVDVTTTEANGKKASFDLPIYFHPDPAVEPSLEDQTSMLALLPGGYLSSVEIEIEFGATGAFGTNQTITAGTVDVQLKELDLTPGEEMSIYNASGKGVLKSDRLLMIYESEISKTVDAAYTDYKLKVVLPTGNVLYRSALFATKAGVRDDTLISAYKVRDERRKFDYSEESWAHSQARDVREYRPVKALEGNLYLTGLTIVDYVEFGALDLRNVQGDPAVLAFTVGAPNGTTNIVVLNQEMGVARYASPA
jgi:hypothetical protein